MNSKESKSSKSQKLCRCVDFHKVRKSNHTSFQPSRERKPAESCMRCAAKTSTQDHSQSIQTYPDPNCHQARSLSAQALFILHHFVFLFDPWCSRHGYVGPSLPQSTSVFGHHSHAESEEGSYLTRFSEVARRPQIVKSLTTMTAAQVH